MHPTETGVFAADPTSLLNPQTLLVALRRWWKIAMPLGLMAAAAIVVAGYYLFRPQYTATVWLTIRDRPEFVLDQIKHEDPIKFLENQQQLLRSVFVLEPVAAKPEIASLPELAEAADRVKALEEQLHFRPLGRSDFFTLEFTSIEPDKAALVVNEVAQSYVQFQGQSQAARNEQLITGLRKEQEKQQAVVDALRSTVETLNEEVAATDPSAASTSSKVIELRDVSTQLETQLINAEVEQAVTKAHLQAEKEFLRTESFAPLPSEVEREIKNAPAVQTIQTRISHGRRKLKEHERTSANLEKNIPYQNLLAQVQDDEAILEKLLAEQRKQVSAEMEKQARDRRVGEIAALERRLASSEFTAKVLRDRLKNERQGKEEGVGDGLRLEFAKADYEQASKVYEAITKQIQSLQLGARAPSRVEIFRKAEPPTMPDGFPLHKLLVLALAGFCAPFGLALVSEYVWQRVSHRGQLETGGNIPVVGELISLPRRVRLGITDRRRATRELAIFDECVDNLRTQLHLSEAMEDVSVLAVTSAISGEGKTSLATQLALSIAAASGQPTLLIDGDMRMPDLHRYFKVEAGDGLAEVLAGAVRITEAVMELPGVTLHLLSAGELIGNPHRLVGGNRFEALIDQLKQTYAHIIIDTPPLLSSSEALVLARAADAAVVCVRRDYSRYSQTAEAFARLKAVGARTAGAVFTDVPARAYASKYGSYYGARAISGRLPSEDSAISPLRN